METKEKLLSNLIKDSYLKTPSIIRAFEAIDRINFVPVSLRNEAYLNQPLPIGFGQTISQPLTVAFMLELLEPKTGEKILDIGAGSGWQTALLAHIVCGPPAAGGKVTAIERLSDLKDFAEENLKKYKFLENGCVKLVVGDGSKGFIDDAPYDKIIVAAAGDEIPNEWREQLKIGGLIVAPVKDSIVVIKKEAQNQFSQKQYFGFSFVPLIKKG